MSDKLAEVVELTERKTAKVRFDGEESISEKEYPYLRSYVPKIGDKVFMKSFNGSYIIFDAISFEVEPEDLKEKIIPEINRLRDDLQGSINDTNNNLKNNYTKTTELENNYTKRTELEKDYLKIDDFAINIDKHTGGSGRRLVRSNVSNGSTYNIDYFYVEPSTKKLQVRTVSGTWYSYNP